MATRMQQRRGTAAQWISTNSNQGPVLNSGEIGFESDTGKFKIGDGVNHWINLPYFVDLNAMVAGAPGLLNSIDELAAALGDDPAFFTTVATNLTNHQNDTTSIHGIADTSLLVTTTGTQTLTNKTITTPAGLVKGDVGLGNVDNTSDANKPVSTATQTALDLKANTSAIAELAQDAVDTAIVAGVGLDKTYDDTANTITLDIDSTVATLTGTQTLTNKTLTSPTVSGLTLSDGSIVLEGTTANAFETTLTVTDPTADRTITFPDSTGTVATQEYVDGAVSNSEVDQSTLAGTGISWNAGTSKFDVDTTTIQARVTDVSDTEIGYLNGVTSAIQTQLDAKAAAASYAALAGATFTGAVSGTSLTLSGDLTVNGTTTNINSTSLVVEDKNIVLGDAATPTDTTADGGGITLKGATDKTFNWVDATDAWTSSEHINLASGKTLKYNGTDLVAAQSGNSGKYLTTDGTSTSWGTVAGYLAPTLGSTSIASGATVTTIEDLTLINPSLGQTVATPTFVAVASGSATATSSTDGITWTARTLPASANWKTATYGAGTFVALASDTTYGTNIAASSTNGITWTTRTLPASAQWMSVTYADGKFVAIASQAMYGNAAAASSTDGITWTARTLPENTFWQSATYGNNTFVAVASGSTTAASSTDGITWTARTLPVSDAWRKIAYGNNTFVAVAGNNSTTAASSTDGITWTTRTLPASAFWESATYGESTVTTSGTLSVAGSTGSNGQYLKSTGTGLEWSSISGYSAPTLGSTSIASGATVTTVAGLTLTAPTLTGTVIASGDINLSAANGPGSLLDELALIMMGAL